VKWIVFHCWAVVEAVLNLRAMLPNHLMHKGMCLVFRKCVTYGTTEVNNIKVCDATSFRFQNLNLMINKSNSVCLFLALHQLACAR
jgi:hypothetical protein